MDKTSWTYGTDSPIQHKQNHQIQILILGLKSKNTIKFSKDSSDCTVQEKAC